MTDNGLTRTEIETDIRIVVCNCSPEESQGLARQLVEERVAACVNIIQGVTSIYEWQGKLCETSEHTLVIKTTAARYWALQRRLEEIHSYDVPEILEISCSDALLTYAQWVHEQVSERG